MISRKGQKAINEGVVGKYVKKDTPPDLPSMFAYIVSCFIVYESTESLLTFKN